MKLCTDISQSKILAVSLPIESADMYYMNGTKHVLVIPNYETDFFHLQENDIPAWSLVVLLNHLKQRYYVRLDHDGISWSITCIEHDTKETYSLFMFEEPIDACWGMILRLNEEEGK